ncbi:MAG TPA: twin-arginine translocase TatA/TatE family subunit [Pyrodictium sp.]|nr:twin-arginine translocase TatA/TatE family subunit [Pyrodictium sp.]
MIPGLQGWEPLIILVAILLIFGPTKLPQLARGLGQALYEFKKASQGLIEEEEKKSTRKGEIGGTESKSAVDEETLKKLAEKLGISTEGKSVDELRKEVIAKAREKGLV